MNTKKLQNAKLVLFGAVLSGALSCATGAQAAELTNTIRAGAILNPIGTVANLDYEHLLNNRFALGARVGSVSYDYNDSTYNETGSGSGVEIIASIYPAGEGFKGFYVAAGLGVWSIDWDWTDPYGYYYTYGNGSSDAVDANISLGWKIPMGTPHAYFEPSLMIGNFFSTTSTSSTGSNNSNLGFYAGVGLHVGAAF